MIRSRGKSLFSSLLLGAVLIATGGGCQSHRPPLSEIVIDTDLPVISEEPLSIGITLDVGCGGKDLLTPNLIPNAGFELAPPLLHCSYNTSTSTLITPNGYKTYYPTPTSLYGWGGQSGEITLSEGRTYYKESSHYLTFRPKDTDSVPCRIISTLFPLEVKEGERYSLSCYVSSDLAEARVSIVRDTLSPKKVSTEASIRGDVYWSRQDVELKITTATDSAYLMIESRPIRRTDEGMGYTQPRGYVSLDELWLTRKEPQSDPEVPLPNALMKLLRGLDPDFVRFPGGRTANGYYPGSYPTPHYGRQDTLSIWTLGGTEYTGDFGISKLIKVSELLSARPMVIANAGITDPSATPRYEDVAEIGERTKYLSRLAMNPKLLVQIGYGLTSEEYKRRFKLFAASIGQDNLVSAGPLVDSTTHYSDYAFDLALTVIEDPHLTNLIPEANRKLQTKRQQMMIGEATFADPESLAVFLPPLAQRAAFLIDSERHTPLLEGVGIAPLLSTDPSDHPLILVRGAHYHPTILYDFVSQFQRTRGDVVHEIGEHDDICLSLTSDKERKHYYLRGVNLTRHPLTYRVRVTGKRQSVKRVTMVRFTPEPPTTTADLSRYYSYVRTEEEISLPLKKAFDLTIEPYQVVLLDFSE